MKRYCWGIRIGSGILCTLLFIGCARETDSTRIVEFTCESDCEVCSFHDIDLGSFHPDKRWVTYTGDYSLFMFEFEELSQELLYFHRKTDGDTLNIQLDEDLLRVNGIVRSIVINDLQDSNFREWFTAATDAEIRGVRFLTADEEISDHFESEFKKIQQVNQMLEYTDANDPEGYITSELLISPQNFETLETFEPHLGKQTKFFLLTDSLDAGLDGKYFRFFKNHPDIRPERLMIMQTDHVEQEFLELFHDVKSLSYGFLEVNGPPPDLSKFGNLEDLFVTLDSHQLELAKLPNPEKLRSLSIFGEWSNIKNPETVKNLEHLLPGEISGKELAAILPMFPGLVSLNLRQTKLQDLSILQAVPNLEVLILGISHENPDIDLNPLRELKNLKYLGLPGEVIENPDFMEKIRKVCPQCYIVHKQTFSICLGSGWLTLFLPLIGLIFLLKRHKHHQSD